MEKVARKLYSAEQVRELDRHAMDGGIPGYVLMQRAASAAWQEVLRRHPSAARIDIVCGPGNNGGDGYQIACLALAAGREVHVWSTGDGAGRGDAALARQAWLDAGGTIRPFTPASLEAAEIVIDAMLGLGLSRDLTGTSLAAVTAINAAHERGAWVMAVDLPSGVDATTGRIWGEAVRADVTITFIGRKLGLYTGAGVDCAGEVLLNDLGIDGSLLREAAPLAELLHQDVLRASLPRRARNSHKGSHGHVLIIGGDAGMAGAALMAGQAALRAGAGWVTLATRVGHAAALTAAQPELMCRGVESVQDLLPLLERAGVVAIGPGLGQGSWARSLLARVLESSLPLMIDADALNLVAEEPSRRDHWVLTPHPGEAARLLGLQTREVQADRPQAAAALQRRYGGVVVLKGAGSLIAGERMALCPYGNAGMAVGGMGDVLTGIIAAFIAQGLPLERATQTAVLAHALAGDRAAADGGERGLLPSDLLAELRGVVNP